jgi:methionyl aminopeptidase
MDNKKILQAGKISSEIKAWIKPQIKKGTPLLEIAEKIEAKILELGGKPAFPTNLSINEIAAHYTPLHNDETKASGLLKVDFGVHIDGWISDTAFSIDLENSPENKKIIEASEKALENALKIIKKGEKISQVGRTVKETINSFELSPIINLSGHQIEQYDLHAGITIPNIDDNRTELFEEGLYAVEPFATNGSGRVKDGKASGIFMLIDERNIRSLLAREVLDYIIEEYQTLPFCSRWLIKKFSTKALIALKQLQENGNLHNFRELVEAGNGIVSQAENTVLIEKDKVTITTK